MLGRIERLVTQAPQGVEDRQAVVQAVGVQVVERGEGQVQRLAIEVQRQARCDARENGLEIVDVDLQRPACSQRHAAVAAQVGQQQQAQGRVGVSPLRRRAGGLQGHVELQAGRGHGGLR